jgi:hypothetical protein
MRTIEAIAQIRIAFPCAFRMNRSAVRNALVFSASRDLHAIGTSIAFNIGSQ